MSDPTKYVENKSVMISLNINETTDTRKRISVVSPTSSVEIKQMSNVAVLRFNSLT